MARLCAATVSGAPCAIDSAYSRVAASSSAAGTTRFTRPMWSASAALRVRAESRMSAACVGPTTCTRRSTLSNGYDSPRRVAGTAKRASAEAKRMSQASATATPPPKQKPWIIAMTGCRVFINAAHARPETASYVAVAAASARSARNSLMSAPLMNACSPAPRRMITRTSGSAASDSIAAARPSQTATLSALRACGRFTTTQASGGSRCTEQGVVGGHG